MRAMVADKGMAQILERAANEGQEMNGCMGQLLRLNATEPWRPKASTLAKRSRMRPSPSHSNRGPVFCAFN